MANDDDEIDLTEIRTGLFALITAKLEDSHELAVCGQSGRANDDDLDQLISDFRSIQDEIAILTNALRKIRLDNA